MWAKRGDEARVLARLNCKRRATDRSPGKKKAPAGAVGQPDIPRFPPVELSCLLRFVPTPLPGSGLPLTLRPRGLTSHSPFLSFLPAHAQRHTHAQASSSLTYPRRALAFLHKGPWRRLRSTRQQRGQSPQSFKTALAATLPGCNTGFFGVTRTGLTMLAEKDAIKRPFQCTWPGCTNSYARSEHLNRHKLNRKSHRANIVSPGY